MIARHPVPPAALARLESLGALAGCPQVLFAYLFGSAASGDLRPLSDVEVAVFLAPGVDRMQGRLAAIDVTTSHLGTDEVDVVVLNELRKLAELDTYVDQLSEYRELSAASGHALTAES